MSLKCIYFKTLLVFDFLQNGAHHQRTASKGHPGQHQRHLQHLAPPEGGVLGPHQHPPGLSWVSRPPVHPAEGVRGHRAPRRGGPDPRHRRCHHFSHGGTATHRRVLSLPFVSYRVIILSRGSMPHNRTGRK